MLKEYKVVITDSSCFIILQKINAIHLLNDLFAVVITTPEIAGEYGFSLPDWVVIQSVTNLSLQENFKKSVDPGEASAIALATEIDYDYLIIDDLEARKFAEKLGLNVKGSVGVLLSAKQKGFIPLIRPYLDMIQQTNFRISAKIIQNVLKAAGE